MSIFDVLRNNWTPIVFGTLFGALVAFIITKISNKTARLRYSTTVERVGFSSNDDVFGNVQITWNNGPPMRNLYLATVEVENTSSRDFEDIEFWVYCDGETNLLSESTRVADSPYIVHWSPSFVAAMEIGNERAATPAQLDTYFHRREYRMPVLNRGQLLHFSYLCTRPNDDKIPGVFLSTQLKGARLFHQLRRNIVHGVPQQIALAHGLVIAFLTAALCGYFLHSAPAASIICMVVGLFAQFFGASEYRLGRLFWKVLAG